MTKYELHSIDAWRYDDGWTWNASYLLEEGLYFENPTSRVICKSLRKWGYLSEESKGRVLVNTDCDGVIEILDKNTSEPILALIANQNL